ncbi:MAG: hypothetical protein AAB676_01915 [Verrucomicrobiota bacterium]
MNEEATGWNRNRDRTVSSFFILPSSFKRKPVGLASLSIMKLLNEPSSAGARTAMAAAKLDQVSPIDQIAAHLCELADCPNPQSVIRNPQSKISMRWLWPHHRLPNPN